MPRSKSFAKLSLSIAILLAPWSVQHAPAQSPLWSSSWLSPSPTAAGPDFTFSPDGEFVYAQISNSAFDYQFTRLDASGNARWSVNLGDGFYTGLGVGKPSLAYADGSAVVALDDPGRIARIGTDGGIQWIRSLPAKELFAIPNQRLIASVCGEITALDLATGDILWQYGNVSDSMSCVRNGVTSDEQGIYAIFPVSPSSSPTGLHTVKLDALGNTLWDVALANADTLGSALIGVSAGLLFERTYDQLRALHTEDGSIAWSVPFANTVSNAVVVAGNPAEAVVIDGASVTRLENDTGGPRWTQAISGDVTTATTVQGDVIVLSSKNLVRIDAVTGGLFWQAPLPATDSSANSLAYLGAGLMGDKLVAVGGGTANAQPPYLQKVDFASGQLVGEIAAGSVPQGSASVSSFAEDTGHIIAASASIDVTAWKLRVRRLDATTGGVLWESDEPLPVSFFWSQYYPSNIGTPSIAVSGSEVVVSFSIGGFLELVSLDRSSGAKRWAQTISDAHADSIYASDPAIDGSENVYFEENVHFSCGQYENCCPQPLTTSCYALRLYKLSSADGVPLWMREGPPVSVNELAFSLAGSDVLLGGPFSGDLSSSTLARLSGGDGSAVQWSSGILPDYGVYSIAPLAGNAVEVLGYGWAKVDATTGATLWTFPTATDPNCTQNTYCLMYDRAVAPNGDIYSVGESNRTLRVQRLRGDGSGMADFWYPVAAIPGLRLVGGQVRLDSGGNVWLRMVRSGATETLAMLAKFDPATGNLSGQQVIGIFDSSDSLATHAGATILDAPSDGKLMIETLMSQPPLPATYGHALLDTTVSAHGDLSVATSIDPPHFSMGDTVTIHLVATYTGDAPVTGVQLTGALPWATRMTAVSCTTQAAANCVVDTRADAIQASFDMQPGGQVEIVGTVRATPFRAEAPVANAVVYGPPGLAESDTANNFSATKVLQSLFFNGFE
jgi:outer membrane protein assembly factor BamB